MLAVVGAVVVVDVNVDVDIKEDNDDDETGRVALSAGMGGTIEGRGGEPQEFVEAVRSDPTPRRRSDTLLKSGGANSDW